MKYFLLSKFLITYRKVFIVPFNNYFTSKLIISVHGFTFIKEIVEIKLLFNNWFFFISRVSCRDASFLFLVRSLSIEHINVPWDIIKYSRNGKIMCYKRLIKFNIMQYPKWVFSKFSLPLSLVFIFINQIKFHKIGFFIICGYLFWTF